MKTHPTAHVGASSRPTTPRIVRAWCCALGVLLGSGAVVAGLSGCATGDEVIEKTPKEEADFHYKLANGYFYERQMPPALSELTVCLEKDPEHPDAHHLMGFIFFGRRDYISAEQHFRKALQIRPGFHQVRANLGALLLEQRRWQDAIEVIEPLVGATLYPTPWVPYNNLGMAYEGLSSKRQALENYKLAVFNNPAFCLGLNNLGRLYREMGDLDQATDTLLRATEKCKGYAEPHFHLAEIYEDRGMAAEARRAFDACYKAAPESPLGTRCRRRL
jgi:type IV pilus assembly protein PilF